MNTPNDMMPGGGEKTELKKNVVTAVNTVQATRLSQLSQLSHFIAAFAGLPKGQHPIATLTSANAAGFRPIHYAASSNNISLLQTLLDVFSCFQAQQCRLLLDCRDRDGNTALHWAVLSGSVDAFVSLIKYGATVNIANFDGRTTLHLAVSMIESLPEQTCLSMVSHLLHYGANPNVGDESGVSPLHLAAELGNVTLIEALIEEGGANVNAVDNEGETALFYALRGQHDAAVRKLLDLGIDFNARNSDGESASDFCNSFGDTEMVQILESAQLKTEELPVLNPRSLSMELSESCALSASSGIWFSGHEVRSSF